MKLPDTPLVRQLSEANITYRQVNCLEFCFQKYTLEQVINEAEEIKVKKFNNYDKDQDCNHLWPLECDHTTHTSNCMWQCHEFGF